MSTTFKDSSGRDWTLALDAPKLLVVRSEIDPEFLIGDPAETLRRLGNDPVWLCQTVWILCREKADDRKVNQEQFYKTVVETGDAIQAATDALEQAILLFIPPRQRELLKLAAAKSRAMQDLLLAKATDKINDQATTDRILASAEQAMDGELDRLSIRLASAMSSRGSSASIPAG